MRVRFGDMAGKVDKSSFVQTEMRRAAMKLHTRDQSKEGEQEKQKPISQWEMKKESVLRFLVDSKVIHSTLDRLVSEYPELSKLNEASSRIRRVPAIDDDIANIVSENPELEVPAPGVDAVEYAQKLEQLAQDARPAFICHFYNTHFAHAAGGRMIGKLISDRLFDGETLEFYKYGGAEPKELLEQVRVEIDNLANGWNPDERQMCVEETANAFKGAGTVLKNLK
eukprot:CAMPEP_0170180810 /NCGR_PEP_ID=MMETSP0040_2-20121228/23095_1 /TAXON_ID=641309 /ORGANISM="Lotharella oceanica, Strain CCMP622" /LENGTH=224 /DNA_ID=CAMNT_0010425587 /DNA_START=76 /DNA_END=750 /DNA_ORIENTATION=+